MKKNDRDRRVPLLTKTIRIMKVTSLCNLLAVCSISASTYAQSLKFSIHKQNSSISEVFKEIEKKSDFTFFFNDNQINVKQKVSVSANNASIEDVLAQVLQNTGYNYQIIDKQILIKVSDKEVMAVPSVAQSDKKITGMVLDATGMPVIGANVMVKGTTNGTITDMDGKFSLDVEEGATLVVSYIGFSNQEIKVGNQTSLSITLKEDSKALDELVVVGYGTQKKVNLTGSVATVDNKALSERPTANVSSLLQGQVPGLQVTQGTGQPGAEGTSMQLRGMGTFSSAGTAPMVLVDGVAGDLSSLSPNEIESISVLKDAASAAIYGARAANGVILVTTKNGKQGKMQISYHVNTGWQQATVLPDLITSSVEYMEMYNIMADRTPGKRKYSEEYIDLYRDPNRNKLLYPDYNWIDETFKTGFIHNHNVTATGGTEKILYNVNFSYMNQDGILPGHGYERFTGRSNVEAKLHERVKLGAKVAFYNGNVEAPAYQNDNYLLFLVQQRPMYMPYLPDGSNRYTFRDLPVNEGGEMVNRNPIYIANETKYNSENWRWDVQAYLDINLLKKDNLTLDWNNKVAFNQINNFSKRLERNDGVGYYYHKLDGSEDYKADTNFGPEKAGVQDSYENSRQMTLFSTLSLNYTIGKHELGGLLGYNQETYKGRNATLYRKWYPSYTIEEINGGSPIDQSMNGNSSEWGLASFFGRVNYAYASKYLLEANFRYDGTSRIYKDHRWGLFPSFSGAWRISEENFVKDNLSWLNNFKLRVSWGKLGNQSIGNYVYHDVYESSNVVIGGEMIQAMNQTRLTDKTLEWEETTITDVGIDINLWNNRFYMTFDWYNKVTSGILNEAPIPASVGLSAPTVNYGKLRNRGVEFQVGHQNQIGDFTYGASFMATLNKNKVLQLMAPSYGSYINEEDLPYGEHYLYEWIGLFQSEEEIANSAKHPYRVLPGDLKLKDQNNDGVIDGDDRIAVSGKHPKMLYSFKLNMGYKNFDLNAFFQGVAGRKIYTNQYVIEPFSQGGPPTVDFRDAWTPENTDTDIPALYGGFSYYNVSSI